MKPKGSYKKDEMLFPVSYCSHLYKPIPFLLCTSSSFPLVRNGPSAAATNAARDFAHFGARFCTPLTCTFYNWHTVCKEPGEIFLRALCIPFVRTLYLFKIPLPGFLFRYKPVLSTIRFKEPNPFVQLLCPTDIEPFG